MTDSGKLFVIGTDIDKIHKWTTARGIPWHRVEPVTGADQLRVRPGQKATTYVWADVDMPKTVLSVIRTQLSIRRCIDGAFDATGLYNRSPQFSEQTIAGVVGYYRNTGRQPVWKSSPEYIQEVTR